MAREYARGRTVLCATRIAPGARQGYRVDITRLALAALAAVTAASPGLPGARTIHRDRTLFRIELATNAPTKLATIPGDAPERMERAAGSLWLTGRGTDLLRVNPDTGTLQQTIEIGAGGIDVVALGDGLWVPVRSAAVDPTGFPTMEALRRVSASSGTVTTIVAANGRVDVHGLGAHGAAVWIADNRAGRLYRLTG
jgi:hypothetical protein